MGEFLDILKENFWELGNSIKDAFLGNEREEHSASWGKEREVLKKSNTGFACTSHKYLPEEEQLLTCAGTGAGKSSNCITTQALAQQSDSMLVIDNSGGIKNDVYQAKLQDGYLQYDMDFDPKEFTVKTMFYNPLAHLDPKDRAAIAKVSSMLAGNLGDKTDYWKLKSEEVLNLAIVIVLTLPNAQRTLYNILLCIEYMATEEELLSNYICALDERTYRQWKLLLSNSENTLASILSSAVGCLSFISNSPTLAKLTSRNTLDFSVLRKTKTIIYIRVPIGSQEVVQPLVNLFFSQFYNYFLNAPLPDKSKDLKIRVLADEFGSCYIPNFPRILSNCRKWFIYNHLIVQSEAQLSQLYGKDGMEIILANVAKMYMGGMGAQEAAAISKSLGTTVMIDAESKHKRNVPLYSASQLMEMKGEAILLVKSNKPFKVKLKPYYQDRSMMKRVNLQIEKQEDSEPIEVDLHPFTLGNNTQLNSNDKH